MVNATDFGSVIFLFKSGLPFDDIGELISLISLRTKIERILNSIANGTLSQYPNNFEDLCFMDEESTSKIYKKHGVKMGKMIAILKGGI